MDRRMKKLNGLEVSSFRPQWRNLLNLISINSPKISPLRVAPVEMTTILFESVNGSVGEDHFNALIKQSSTLSVTQKAIYIL